MPTQQNKKLHMGLSRRSFWLCAAVLVLLRLAVAGVQQAYIWVGGAPLDDELMFRAANAVTAGEWLGGYDYLTLSKSMFFPLWLALTHALHLNFLVAGAMLWCAASALAAAALRPLWRCALPNRSRAYTLLAFAALAFLPSSWASYTLRIYRDNIFPALSLLCVAGLAGAALRAVFYTAKQAPLWPWLLGSGIGLGCAYLTREDAGLFLLPFCAVATLVLLVVLVRRRRWLCCAAQGIPYVLLAAGVLAFCTLNYQHYGVFALSDFSEGAFADAMGAMMRVDTQSEELLLSVPADARALIYDTVPELQGIAAWLEEDTQLQNDFRDPELGDYRAGSFYWAIRRAAQFEGVYATAMNAEAFWAQVAQKINAACDVGTLPSRTAQRSATTQPIRAGYVPAALAESVRGLWHVLYFAGCAPYEVQRSIGTEEDFAAWSAYLNCGFNSAAEAGLDTPYYSPQKKAVFALLGALRWVYVLALIPGFVAAVLLHFAALPGVLRRRSAKGWVPWLLLLGLLGLAALRCGMIAFVEVSSFGIGTSTMYLATVHPLLLLYTLGSLLGDRYDRKEPSDAKN